MDDTLKTVIYSIIGIVLGLAVISAGWLIRENRRLYSKYLQEKYLWYEKNRDLEFKIDQLQADLNEFRKKFQKTQIYITRLEEEKKEAEERLQQLAEENQKLREKVTRLVKENNEFQSKLNKYKSSPQVTVGDEFWSNILRDKANLELQLNSLQRLLEKKDKQIQDVEQSKQQLQARLQRLSHEKQQLEAKLAEVKKLVSDLSSSLQQEKQEKLKYVQELQRLETEQQNLTARVTSVEEERKHLQQKIVQLKQQLQLAQKQKEAYNKRLAEINQILEDKMLEVTKLKKDLEVALENIKKLSYNISSSQAVTLPKIEVKTKRVEGKILQVDCDNGFVIIDLGRRDGLKEGMKCNVYRKGELIAKLEVIKTEEVTSAARIVKGLPYDQITESDSVAILNNFK